MNKIEELYYPNLYEAAVALNSTRSPKEIISNLVERTARAMSAKGCSLMLLSHDKKHLIHTIAYGLSDRYLKKGPVLADTSISEALGGNVVAVLNAAEDDRIQYPEQAAQEGIASILSVPMKLRDEIIGVIRVYTAEPHQFSIDDMYFASAIANLAAIALENARFYKSTLQDVERLKQDLTEWKMPHYVST
jgi:GAF domain-containing protein